MTIAFISDLHLSYKVPHSIQLFEKFLLNYQGLEKLFILGDLFDIWLGDSISLTYYDDLMGLLRAYNHPKARIYVMKGNRDFLLNRNFFNSSKCLSLSDPHVIEVNQQKIILCHGDSLCTDDKLYQWYRKVVRSPITLAIYDYLPQSLKKRIANRIRQYSKNNMQGRIVDINEKELFPLYHQYNAHIIIHGHTHIPAIHLLYHEHTIYKRYVLSDWHNQGNVLIWDEKTPPKLCYFD